MGCQTEESSLSHKTSNPSAESRPGPTKANMFLPWCHSTSTQFRECQSGQSALLHTHLRGKCFRVAAIFGAWWRSRCAAVRWMEGTVLEWCSVLRTKEDFHAAGPRERTAGLLMHSLLQCVLSCLSAIKPDLAPTSQNQTFLLVWNLGLVVTKY